MDNPRVRNVTVCPVCGGNKDRGLVVCWGCNARLKAEHGGAYGESAERAIALAERLLIEAQAGLRNEFVPWPDHGSAERLLTGAQELRDEFVPWPESDVPPQVEHLSWGEICRLTNEELLAELFKPVPKGNEK